MFLPPPYRAEVSRKVLHLLSAAIPAVYMLVDRPLMLRLLAPCVALAVIIEVLRHVSASCHAVFRRLVGFMVRAAEWQRVTGATYVLIGALLAVWLFPKPVAVAALLIQIISDSLASLVGLSFGRTRFLGKSLAGSLAFFGSALVILWLVLPDSIGAVVGGALVATLVEALPTLKLGRLELNDNLTVPVLTGATVWALETAGATDLVAAVARFY